MSAYNRRESQHRLADGTSKRAYLTRDEAKMVVKKMRRLVGASKGKHFNVYLCPECDKYHIGGRSREGTS